MASSVLYPPIIESSMPAFVANKNAVCRVYFSLSHFNDRDSFKNVQVSVVKQDSGLSVVNRINGNNRYRATGVILNVPVHPTEQNNLYYIELYNDDIGYRSLQGWTPGWFYKIQLRLSAVEMSAEYADKQAAWLNNNASNFSEWSTICLVKAIGEISIKIPLFEFNSLIQNNNIESASLMISTLDVVGTYENSDPSELLTAYNVELHQHGELLESSGLIYTNQYVNPNEFVYSCKTDLNDTKQDESYTLKFYYKTINEYEGVEEIDFNVIQGHVGDTQAYLKIYSESDKKESLNAITTIAFEEDEGRVGIRFAGDEAENRLFSGNLCIRRTDSTSDFKLWHDIGLVVVKEQLLENVPIFYDYTIESGIIYKYGVQTISSSGERGNLNITDKEIIRSFEYSYLLGENNQQLKLKFNNNMNSYKITRNDVKTDTIGGVYPFIGRNGATKYRTFPVNGLISFEMDTEEPASAHTFLPKDFFTGRENDVYTKERVFREAVLEFLYNDKPKLFKSPTEGNIIIRLMDINCTPEQSLGRLLYNFSATAYEVAEANLDNYLKYNFYKIDKYETDFSNIRYKVGQLQGNFSTGQDIIELIKNKYEVGKIVANYTQKVTKIIGLKISFEGDPLRIRNNANQIVLGNNFKLNDKIITVVSGNRIYEFDEEVVLTPSDTLVLLGDAEELVNDIHATIDFVYEITSIEVAQKEVASRKLSRHIGQFRGVLQSSYQKTDVPSLHSLIYWKYYVDWKQEYRKLNRIASMEIEANPGVIFKVQDQQDEIEELHEVNATGILRIPEMVDNIKNIYYYGTRLADGSIDFNTDADVIVNYLYYLEKGIYK